MVLRYAFTIVHLRLDNNRQARLNPLFLGGEGEAALGEGFVDFFHHLGADAVQVFNVFLGEMGKLLKACNPYTRQRAVGRGGKFGQITVGWGV